MFSPEQSEPHVLLPDATHRHPPAEGIRCPEQSEPQVLLPDATHHPKILSPEQSEPHVLLPEVTHLPATTLHFQ